MQVPFYFSVAGRANASGIVLRHSKIKNFLQILVEILWNNWLLFYVNSHFVKQNEVNASSHALYCCQLE